MLYKQIVAYNILFMDTYKRISDSIEELSKGKVVKRKNNPVIPVICIVGGLLLMWWGIAKWADIGYEQTSYVLVTGGLFLTGWGIVMLTFQSNYYVVIDSQERIKPEKVYLDPVNKDKIIELLKNDQLEAVLNQGLDTKTPLLLEVWKANGHELLYSQLIYHKNKNQHIPITHPMVTEKSKISSI